MSARDLSHLESRLIEEREQAMENIHPRASCAREQEHAIEPATG